MECHPFKHHGGVFGENAAPCVISKIVRKLRVEATTTEDPL